MSWKELSDRSFVISSGRYFYKLYIYIEQTVTEAYYNSQVYKLVNTFNANVKKIFTDSLLIRTSKIKRTTVSMLLSNSCILKSIFTLYKNLQIKLINYLRACLVVKRLADLKTELYFFPVRLISIFVVIATIVNLVLCLIFNRQIDTWGYLIRGLFLFAGISGIFCKADWTTVKENSIFFKNVV